MIHAYPSAATARDLPPMIIDSFAGGGGASTGIELALGRSPDVAINHSAKALALHAANHPETLHLDSNIWDVEPREVARDRKVGLLWASPDCKHFSKAKGGAPRDRNIRDLAWIVVKWAEEVKPDVILMENVEEFVTWGPVGEDGQPIKEFAGQTFELWINRLKKAGYKVKWNELRACDYGAPTIRKRWFLVARRDGQPIIWPKPTHGDPKSPAVRKGKLLPWRNAAECIDWSEPCPSVFDTRAEILEKHGLKSQRPLKPNTLHRVARGIARYVLEADRPFIVNLTHGAREEDLADPFRTITGAHRGEKALVVPSITRFNSGATGSDLREPIPTITANSWIKKPGGAAPIGMIAPCLASIAHGYSGGRREYSLEECLGTVTVGGIQHALVAPHLLSLKGSSRRMRPIDLPHPTVLAEGGHSALIAPHIMTMRNSGKPFQGADQPTHTITAGGAGLSMIAASMIQTGYGEREGQEPRALAIGKPLGTVVAGGVKHAPIAAFLARQFGNSIGHAAEDPHGTITAGGAGKSAPVAAFLAQQNNDSRRAGGVNPGRPAVAPMSTICASGSHQNLTTAWFAKYYGTGDGARMDEPAHTITVKDRLAHMQADLAAPPFGPEHEPKARKVAELLREFGLWDDREFLTLSINGAEFVIVDVGMRMLTPRELFRAQGFPDDYVIEGVWEEGSGWENIGHNGGPRFIPFPKDVQVSCCGNSVCPPLAEALVRANCAHLMVREEAA